MKITCALFVLSLHFALSFGSSAQRVTTPTFGEARQPQPAISNDGTTYVAFGRAEAIYVTRADPDAITFSEPVKVGELPKLALGMRRGPRIAILDQAVITSAISHEDGNLYSWRSDDQGRTWSRPHRINTVPKSAVEGMHGLASDNRTRAAAVWLDLRSGKTEIWSSVSEDAGRTWAPNTRVYRSPDLTVCECCHPSIVWTPAGEIVVMWRNWLDGNRDLFTARSVDGGKSFTAAAKVGTGTWKLHACPMDGGSVAADGREVAYTWRRENQLFATTDPNSETLLSRYGTQPVAIRTLVGFGYLWQDQANVYWFAPKAGEPVILAQKASFAASAWNPREAKSLIVWEGHDGGVYARMLP
jgi:hypothetical protein